MKHVPIAIAVVVFAVLLARSDSYAVWAAVAVASLWMGVATYARRYLPALRRTRGAVAIDPGRAGAAQRLGEAGLGEAIEGIRVGIRGKVDCSKPLRAPISGRPCVAYRLDVQVSSGSGGRWADAPPTQESVPFVLRDGDQEIAVLPEGARLEVRAGAPRRYSRARALQSPLRDLLPLLDAVVDREAPAFRVSEAVLPVGASACVWGTLTDAGGHMAIGGSPEEDEGDLVISDAPPEALRRRVSSERNRALALAGFCLLLAVAAGWRGADRYRVARHRGKLYVRNASAQKVTVRLCSGRPEDGTWNYDPYEASSKTLGTYLTDDDKPVLIAAGDRLTVSRWRTATASALLKEDTLAHWDSAAHCWTLNIEPALFAGKSNPAPAPSAAVAPHAAVQRRGQVYLRNLSSRQVKIFYRPKDGEIVPGHWTFKPGRGRDHPNGVRLLDGDHPQMAATGDALLLEFLNAGTAVVRLGDPGGASWRASDGAWFLAMDEAFATGRAGVLRVRNRTDWNVRLVIRRPDGVAYGSSWAFDPREGAESASGLNLQIQKVDVIFRGEDRIEATATVPGTERPLVVGTTPEPVWRPQERCWLLDLRGDAAP